MTRSAGDEFWGGLPPEKSLGLRGDPAQKQRGRKWVAFGVDVKDGRDWMTAVKNVGTWHRGVETGAEALDDAWWRGDFCQSNPRRGASMRLVDLYNSYVRDLVWLFFFCYCFYLFSSCNTGESPAWVLLLLLFSILGSYHSPST